MTHIHKLVLSGILLSLTSAAQPTVGPTRAATGIARGDSTSGYNVRQSFELGYRFRGIGGNTDSYQSMVNFGKGLRLLDSNLSVQSLEGHGRYFDQIQLNTQGLGNDPYQSASLRVEKNRIYRYDLNWRSNAYLNPGVRGDRGRNQRNTTRLWQDQDLTVFPQSAIKFFLGFSRNTQTGPGLSGAIWPDGGSDQYALLADIRRQQHEYRAGFEAGFKGWKLNVLHGWVNFKEDTTQVISSLQQGFNTTDQLRLTGLVRSEPYHGNSPYWRVVLFKEGRKWASNARFTYVNGQRGFVQDETGYGTNRLGAANSRQVYAAGDARRPAATGSVNFSLFPVSNLTLTNQTAISHIRMSGSSVFTQLNNGVAVRPSIPFSFLGIRTITNASDADYRPFRWLGVRLGYQYSTRRIRSIEALSPVGPQTPLEQENGLHTGILGLRLRPFKNFTANLDGEIGRADRPVFPVSGRNFQAFRARAEYRGSDWRIAGYARTDYNVNSATLSSFASRSRQYGADANWTPSRNFFIDASYVKMHFDSLGVMNYFARTTGTGNSLVADQSWYVSNLHNLNLNTHFVVRDRIELTLGVSHVQDTGDGRTTAMGSEPYGAITFMKTAQTFPLRFTSPQAKLSYRITDDLRWNLGYQHYAYAEDFGAPQNFRSHTGYASLSWSF
jgi:hypothetical protein